MNGWGVDVTPSLRPSPPQGGEGLSVLSPLPEGEGWVGALFVFFLMKVPLPRLRRYFPQRGKIIGAKSSPSGGSSPKGRRGPCLPSVFPAKAGRAVERKGEGLVFQPRHCERSEATQ